MTRLLIWLAGWAWLLFSTLPAQAVEPCFIGFDVGSSGIRAGSLHSDRVAKVKVDYLGDVWPDKRVDVTNETSITAFRKLPEEIGLRHCLGVAGGYSAWRFAMEQGKPEEVVATLAQFQEHSGVYFFVMPQEVEGAYGYFAARQRLGARLRTPFILDIGGGSLQIASQQNSWGAPLGQNAWRKLFCEQIKQSTLDHCIPNPVGATALAQTQAFLALEISHAKTTLGSGFTLTAISSLVVKEVHPILLSLARQQKIPAVDPEGFSLQALTAAIRLLADKDDSTILSELEKGKPDNPNTYDAHFVATFVTDMLLLHAFMEGLGVYRLEVSAADVTNVPGILSDPRPKAWSQHYPCYLDRLKTQGIQAFLSDPATCPPAPASP